MRVVSPPDRVYVLQTHAGVGGESKDSRVDNQTPGCGTSRGRRDATNEPTEETVHKAVDNGVSNNEEENRSRKRCTNLSRDHLSFRWKNSDWFSE